MERLIQLRATTGALRDYWRPSQPNAQRLRKFAATLDGYAIPYRWAESAAAR
jgi:hypothetical protein